MFLLINNIVANRDRLFNKFHMVPSPNCLMCNVLHDNVHLFCECILVREAWFWVRQRLLGLLPDSHARTSNFEFLNLMFERDIMDSEVIWMIGNFVQLVWDVVICKKNWSFMWHLRICLSYNSKCKSGNRVGSPEKYVSYTETCVCQKIKSLNFSLTILLTGHALS